MIYIIKINMYNINFKAETSQESRGAIQGIVLFDSKQIKLVMPAHQQLQFAIIRIITSFIGDIVWLFG